MNTTAIAPTSNSKTGSLGQRLWWQGLGRLLFRLSLPGMHPWRRVLLRLAGARMARNVRVSPRAKILCPWNLTASDGVIIEAHAVLDCTAPVTLGPNVIVERCAIICTRDVDPVEPQLPICLSIHLGAGVHVGVDSFVGPGLNLPAGTRIQDRGTITHGALS